MINTEKNIPTDEQLVKEIAGGDHYAFKILYYRYFKSLVRFAWYRVHSTDISRDLVQEVFIKTWLHRNNLNPEKSIKAYLYRSLTNAIINYTKLHSTRAISIDDVSENKRSQEHEDQDFQIDIQKALSRLPEKLKTVYTLSRVEGYKYSEIAEICEISVKAVEKRLTKAFSLLKVTFTKKYF